jgi:hypothetical protein
MAIMSEFSSITWWGWFTRWRWTTCLLETMVYPVAMDDLETMVYPPVAMDDLATMVYPPVAMVVLDCYLVVPCLCLLL